MTSGDPEAREERRGASGPTGSGGRAGDPPSGPRGARWAFAVGVAAYLASLALGRAPELVEAVYVSWALPLVSAPLSRVTGWIPVPLGELLLGGYLAWRAVGCARGVAALRDPTRSGRHALARGGGVLLRDAGVALLLFYLLWGFHYARAPLTERIGLPALGAGEGPGLVARLAEASVEEGNRQYRLIHGVDDAGRPTAMPDRWTSLGPALERGWEATAGALRLGPASELRYGPPKAALSSPLLARLGLAGFYFPYTAEALANARTPAVALAATLAHEQAHQRGVTDEGEATFLGHLVAGRSGSPLLRYSAAVRAQSRLLRALGRRDPERARALAERRIPGVVRDLDDLQAYHRRHSGPARRVASSVNDAYLRANRVPGGVASYDRVTELLLRYAALKGRLYPDDTGARRTGPVEGASD